MARKATPDLPAVPTVVLHSSSHWPVKSIALVPHEGYHSVFTVSIRTKEMAGRTDRCTGITWGCKVRSREGRGRRRSMGLLSVTLV